MKKQQNVIFKRKKQIVQNIKAIRCYLQLDRTEFAKKTGIGPRATEFENGRFRPTVEEINKIAELANINPAHIVNQILYQTLQIA